ncbi:MAG: hypothetical protein NVS4B7_00980 [Ktedonobacteraceae bacterium]
MKKVASFLVILTVIVSALATVTVGLHASTEQTHSNTTQLISHASKFAHVQGTQIVDGAGKPLYLRGAEIVSAFTDMGSWKAGVRLSNVLNPTIFKAMVQTWKMNTLRLPLSNWIWAKDSVNYMHQLDTVIQEANTAGLYVVLNLHDDGKAGSPYGDRADLPKTQDQVFWIAMATHYKANSMVLFDLYNEPKDTSWPMWLNGHATVSGATVVGHQNLVNAIRAAGAPQIVIVEPGSAGGHGKAWSNVGNSLINDPNVIYSLHVYDYIWYNPQQQDALWGPTILNHHPLYYGEWALLTNGTGVPGYDHCKYIVPGQANQVVQNFLSYMNSRNASWTAWDFAPYHLIQNYTNFAPTTLNIPWKCGNPTSHAGMGTVVQNYLSSGH